MKFKKRFFYYNAIEDVWQEERCSQDNLEYRLREMRIDDWRFSYVYLPLSWSVDLLPNRVVELVLHTKMVTLEENKITEVMDKRNGRLNAILTTELCKGGQYLLSAMK